MMKKIFSASLAAAMCLTGVSPVSTIAAENKNDMTVGETSQSTEAQENAKVQMTLDDVIELSKKGEALVWADFEKYNGEEIEMGCFKYDLEDGYKLLLDGFDSEQILYIVLRCDEREDFIDIRTDDVEEFLTKSDTENKKKMTFDDVVELSKKGDELDWSDFDEYDGKDIVSDIFIRKFLLEDGYNVKVGGINDKKPYFVTLSHDDEEGIDIRKDNVEDYLSDYISSDSYEIEEYCVNFYMPVDVMWIFSNGSYDNYIYNNSDIKDKCYIYPSDYSKNLVMIGKYNVDIDTLPERTDFSNYDLTLQCYIVEDIGDNKIIVHRGKQYFLPSAAIEENKQIIADTEEDIYTLAAKAVNKDHYFQYIKARGKHGYLYHAERLHINGGSDAKLLVTREDANGETITEEYFPEYVNSETGAKRYQVNGKRDLNDDNMSYADYSYDERHKNVRVTKIENGISTFYDVEEIEWDLMHSTLKISKDRNCDLNGDGEFNISDVVMLQKWLLKADDTKLDNWKAADLCTDNKIDIFDLVAMRKKLIEKSNSVT